MPLVRSLIELSQLHYLLVDQVASVVYGHRVEGDLVSLPPTINTFDQLLKVLEFALRVAYRYAT